MYEMLFNPCSLTTKEANQSFRGISDVMSVRVRLCPWVAYRVIPTEHAADL
jgi:hypothetical protein